MNLTPKIGVGILGLGTVGAGVVKILNGPDSLLAKRIGLSFDIRRVVRRGRRVPRGVPLARSLLSTDYRAIVRDPRISIAVELAGGLHPALEYVMEALDRGKHVVTANKALIAEEGPRIFEKARERGVTVAFEASTGGGIPILGAIRDGLVGNRIDEIYGIVNGTSNFILDEMTRAGSSYREALGRAQKAGYAEKDPTLDVEGIDSAHKLAILARVGFGVHPPWSKIHRQGIASIRPEDIKAAGELGRTIKLLASARRGDGGLELSVQPTLLPADHPLAAVHGVFNAVWVRGDPVGDTMFLGPGAGQGPTASAVVSDLVEVAMGRAEVTFRKFLAMEKAGAGLALRPVSESSSRYFLRFRVEDRPGILGRIATILGGAGISIASVNQHEGPDGGPVPVVILTHRAGERSLAAALAQIDRLPTARKPALVLRVW